MPNKVSVKVLKREEAFDTKGLINFAQKFFKDKFISGEKVDGITRRKKQIGIGQHYGDKKFLEKYDL